MMGEKLGPNQLLRAAAGYDPGEEPVGLNLRPSDDQPPSPPRGVDGKFVSMDELFRAAAAGRTVTTDWSSLEGA
jgi:hypothetical protein